MEEHPEIFMKNKALTDYRGFLRPTRTIFSSSRTIETERHSISVETSLAGITPELIDIKVRNNLAEPECGVQKGFMRSKALAGSSRLRRCPDIRQTYCRLVNARARVYPCAAPEGPSRFVGVDASRFNGSKRGKNAAT